MFSEFSSFIQFWTNYEFTLGLPNIICYHKSRKPCLFLIFCSSNQRSSSFLNFQNVIGSITSILLRGVQFNWNSFQITKWPFPHAQLPSSISKVTKYEHAWHMILYTTGTPPQEHRCWDLKLKSEKNMYTYHFMITSAESL